MAVAAHIWKDKSGYHISQAALERSGFVTTSKLHILLDENWFRKWASQQAQPPPADRLLVRYCDCGLSPGWSQFAALYSARPALFLVGAAALALLLIGIHNAWDAVTYQVLLRSRQDGWHADWDSRGG